MADSTYSTAGVHLPTNSKLVELLRQLSLYGNLIVVILLGLVFWMGLKIPFGIALMFLIITGSTLFHATESSGRKVKIVFTCVPVTAGILVILYSIYLYFFSSVQMSLYTFCSFIFMGLAIAIPYIRGLAHRFHPAQFLAIMTLIPNLMATLGTAKIDFSEFYISLLFTVMSLAVLLRWPGRGFVSLFTAESVSSKFAFRLLVSISFIFPFLGYLTWGWARLSSASTAEMVAVMIVSVGVTLIILIWINIKLMYMKELENFLMKEELRVHNINLKLNNEDLEGKMQELESAKKRYVAELNYQDRFRDIAEGLD